MNIEATGRSGVTRPNHSATLPFLEIICRFLELIHFSALFAFLVDAGAFCIFCKLQSTCFGHLDSISTQKLQNRIKDRPMYQFSAIP